VGSQELRRRPRTQSRTTRRPWSAGSPCARQMVLCCAVNSGLHSSLYWTVARSRLAGGPAPSQHRAGASADAVGPGPSPPLPPLLRLSLSTRVRRDGLRRARKASARYRRRNFLGTRLPRNFLPNSYRRNLQTDESKKTGTFFERSKIWPHVVHPQTSTRARCTMERAPGTAETRLTIATNQAGTARARRITKLVLADSGKPRVKSCRPASARHRNAREKTGLFLQVIFGKLRTRNGRSATAWSRRTLPTRALRFSEAPCEAARPSRCRAPHPARV